MNGERKSFSRDITQEKRHMNVKTGIRDSLNDNANQFRNRSSVQAGSRPLGLLRDSRSRHDSFKKGIAGGRNCDDVFFSGKK